MIRTAPVLGLGTTLSATIDRGDQTELGYRRLTLGPGEPHQVRRDLGGATPQRYRPLACFVQLSDLHVMDAQSPARAEYLDRFGDADSPLVSVLGRVGLYRAQEALTAQVVEAMVRAVSQVERGPLTGAPIECALSTGDATDNCQSNEFEAYLALLDGDRKVSLDSGTPGRYEGVGATELFDARYWHPDGSPNGEAIDIPRQRHGFLLVPGLFDAAMTPFAATGLPLPWYAVYGNHDALLGGTLNQHDALAAVAVGGQKPVGLVEGTDPLLLLGGNEIEPSLEQWGLLSGPTVTVTADPNRGPVSREAWIGRHLAATGRPKGHGLLAAGKRACHYGFDIGVIRFLVLDTVNQAGGWQGSLDDEQFQWLEQELVAGSSAFDDRTGRRIVHHASDRLFVLVSHHPIETLTNGFSPQGLHRHLAEEVRALIGRFPNVVCWVNGHTHCNTIRPVHSPKGATQPGFWQITTASHVDWPQQSRIIELAIDGKNGDLAIGTTMIDHLGLVHPKSGEPDDALTIAGWSRELSANAWQGRIGDEPAGRGDLLDRNAVLVLPAPFALGV